LVNGQKVCDTLSPTSAMGMLVRVPMLAPKHKGHDPAVNMHSPNSIDVSVPGAPDLPVKQSSTALLTDIASRISRRRRMLALTLMN
jgi:hypothetical protein